MSSDRKILIVDDEPHIRKLVSLIAKQVCPYPQIEATNGAEAVEIYRQQKPDIVLMDVNMPIKDGLEALKEIMALAPLALVAMHTSLANRQNVEEAFHGGAVYYLRKDTPKDEIVSALRGIIEDYIEKLEARE